MALDTPEEIDLEEKLKTTEKDYIFTFKILLAAFEDLQNLNEAVLKVHEENRLQRFIEDNV